MCKGSVVRKSSLEKTGLHSLYSYISFTSWSVTCIPFCVAGVHSVNSVVRDLFFPPSWSSHLRICHQSDEEGIIFELKREQLLTKKGGRTWSEQKVGTRCHFDRLMFLRAESVPYFFSLSFSIEASPSTQRRTGNSTFHVPLRHQFTSRIVVSLKRETMQVKASERLKIPLSDEDCGHKSVYKCTFECSSTRTDDSLVVFRWEEFFFSVGTSIVFCLQQKRVWEQMLFTRKTSRYLNSRCVHLMYIFFSLSISILIYVTCNVSASVNDTKRTAMAFCGSEDVVVCIQQKIDPDFDSSASRFL